MLSLAMLALAAAPLEGNALEVERVYRYPTAAPLDDLWAADWGHKFAADHAKRRADLVVAIVKSPTDGLTFEARLLAIPPGAEWPLAGITFIDENGRALSRSNGLSMQPRPRLALFFAVDRPLEKARVQATVSSGEIDVAASGPKITPTPEGNVRRLRTSKLSLPAPSGSAHWCVLAELENVAVAN